MNRFLAFIFLSLLTLNMLADGSHGTYTIVGIAYGPDSISLKNIEVEVKFGTQTKTIKTNERGGFEIEVKWKSTTDSINKNKDTAELNPEFIYFTYNGEQIQLINSWQNYINYQYKPTKKKQDLLFKAT